jgi:hypothetical protein
MLSAVDRYVIARESNIARRFQPRARSATPCFPGANVIVPARRVQAVAL